MRKGAQRRSKSPSSVGSYDLIDYGVAEDNAVVAGKPEHEDDDEDLD